MKRQEDLTLADKMFGVGPARRGHMALCVSLGLMAVALACFVPAAVLGALDWRGAAEWFGVVIVACGMASLLALGVCLYLLPPEDRASEPVRVFMDGVDFQYALGEAACPIPTYADAEDLADRHEATGCGIVEVEIRFVRWAEPQRLTYRLKTSADSPA